MTQGDKVLLAGIYQGPVQGGTNAAVTVIGANYTVSVPHADVVTGFLLTAKKGGVSIQEGESEFKIEWDNNAAVWGS